MFWLRLSAAVRPAVIILVLIVVGLVLYQFLAGPSTPDLLDTTYPAGSDEAAQEARSEAMSNPPRAIAPEQFATPFAQNAARLERVAARAPLTPTISRDTGPHPTLLHKPLVIAAGELAFQEGGLRLKGLVVTDPDETCTAPDGSLWPCGIIARTAFRNFVGGRSLSCVLPDDRWRDIIVVSCLVGRQDPAAWLARSGWARTFVGSNYSEMEREAIQESRGLHGTDPRVTAAIPDSGTVIEPDGINPGSDPLPVPLR